MFLDLFDLLALLSERRARLVFRFFSLAIWFRNVILLQVLFCELKMCSHKRRYCHSLPSGVAGIVNSNETEEKSIVLQSFQTVWFPLDSSIKKPSMVERVSTARAAVPWQPGRTSKYILQFSQGSSCSSRRNIPWSLQMGMLQRVP